ncbi:hypothetical protein B566_EDAN012650, partial [Ephemera danica]
MRMVNRDEAFKKKLCELVLTIPSTTVGVERYFSPLYQIMDYLGTTLVQESLSSLTLISIEKKMVSKLSKYPDFYDNVISVITQYTQKYPDLECDDEANALILSMLRQFLNLQTNQFKFDAFVSYSSADRSWVFEKLMKTLESEDYKYTLCLHERDFHLGNYIMDNVSKCIEKSRHWCQWELKLVQQIIFEKNPEFLILIELQRVRQKDLPSSLRLLMCTRTYLECPEEGTDMSSFWRRLKKILGEPIVQQCNVETEYPENIIEQMLELYQQE